MTDVAFERGIVMVSTFLVIPIASAYTFPSFTKMVAVTAERNETVLFAWWS